MFGAPRRGFEFTDLELPPVDGPEGLRSYRDPLPEGVEFEFDRPPMPFWEEIVECRPAIGRPPWEPFEDGPAECAYWYRLDDPPVLADGSLDPLAAIVLCDTMPGAVGQKLGRALGQLVRARAPTSRSTCSARPDPAGCSPTTRPATPATATPRRDGPLGPVPTARLVAYATQVMFFTFL